MRTRWGLAATIVGLVGAVGCGSAPPPGPPEPTPSEATPPVSTSAPAPTPGPTPVPRGAWTYEVTPTSSGEKRTATVTGPDWTLTFTSDPNLGRNVRFVPARRDFGCTSVCPIQVAVDGREAERPIRASMLRIPAGTVAVSPAPPVWELTATGASLTLTYPTTPDTRGPTATATFPVTGVDTAALPGF